jgi:integrase
VEEATLQRHGLLQLGTENAPLVQTFEEAGGRPFTVNLTSLSSRPELARVLANSFWMIYGPGPRRATVRRMEDNLELLNRFLNYRSTSQPDVRTTKDLSTDLLKEFAVWLVAKHKLKRMTAANVFTMCCCFLRRSRRLYSEEFNPLFSTPRNLFVGAANDPTESRVLSLADFQKILAAAENDIRHIRETYKPGDVPTSPQHLIPFMVIIAARTGINPFGLYELERDCFTPHAFDENLFYFTWGKPRAGKPQRQLHRADRGNATGVWELIQFLRQFTEPLASAAAPPESTRLFLYLYQSPRRAKTRILSPSIGGLWVWNHFRTFIDRHGLPRFTLLNIRPTAATQLYLETGGNLRKVQQFLQHADLRTTVGYVLNNITQPFNARAIQKAQERMIERVTVIPETRTQGVVRLGLSKTQSRKIAAGRFDTGCGTCRDPYDSPQPGEEKGRLCTSFHACFSCPNALWFLEELPQVIVTRDRLVSLKADMSRIDWEMIYGENVRIIEEHIIAAFRPEQIRAAEIKAKEERQRPVLVSKGVLA